jgi:hypothetical protein
VKSARGAPSARFGGPKKGKWATMGLPNIDRTLWTGKCLSESRVENGSMTPEREERGTPRRRYPGFVCYLALFSQVMRNLTAGGWGNASPWRGSSVGTGLEQLEARAIMDPVNIVDTSACDGYGGTTSPPALTSGSSRGLRAHPDKRSATRRQQKKIAKSEYARLQVATLVAVVRVPHLIVWRR